MEQALDRDLRSALHYAARDGDAAAVRRLLMEGHDPRQADRHGWTPLHFAAQASSWAAAAALLDAGAEVDVQDEHGNTPLFRAAFESRDRGEVIRLLLARGADPHRPNRHGQTPLGLARTIANFDVARHFDESSTQGHAPAS